MVEPRHIDTTVFMRFFLRDDVERSQAALKLLQRIEMGEEVAFTTTVALFEVIYTLQKTAKYPKAMVRDALTYVLGMPNLRIAEKTIFFMALDLYVEKNIAFGDAYIAAVMRHQNIREVYSFDGHFDRIPDITRIVPQSRD